MPKRASPRLIGAFVLGAIVLLVAGLAFLGGGGLFHRRPLAVAYFQGSVKGLYVGALVGFRGVPIGTVKGIDLDLDINDFNALIRVTLEFEPERITFLGGGHRASLVEAVGRGLRARLSLQSFVTGQLGVDVDFHPEIPAHLVGRDHRLPEIPTVKSALEQAQETFERLPIQDLANQAVNTLHSLDALVSSPALKETLDNAAKGSRDFALLMSQFREATGTLSGQLGQTLGQVDNTLQRMGDDVHHATADAPATLAALRTSLASADRAFRQTNRLLTSLDDFVAPGSPQRDDIDSSLRDLAEASRSIRQLTEELDRNPNTLLFGPKEAPP